MDYCTETGAKVRNGLVWKGKIQNIKGQADMEEQLAEIYGSTAAENAADTVAGTAAATVAGNTVPEGTVAQRALDGNTVTGNAAARGAAAGGRDAAAGSTLAEGALPRGAVAEGTLADAAREEFLAYGYMNASMRRIAAAAGCTTGTLYYRFRDKGELFRYLVDDAANEFMELYKNANEEFSKLPPSSQISCMAMYSHQHLDEMLGIIYRNFDAFKLIVSCGAGSGYEDYIDRLARMEEESTVAFIGTLKDAGRDVPEIRQELCHMLSNALFNGIFETVVHGFSYTQARDYVHGLERFFTAGWYELLGMAVPESGRQKSNGQDNQDRQDRKDKGV
uniref:TetR/AcrR family transcriptional regulator n=1 Tax=uncultured Scardovia sp. TaxID=655654 RepID=UPI00374EB98E